MNRIRTKSKDTNLIDQRRRMIAERSRKVFMKTGFNATTMDEIARMCQMTSGNIYRYIGTKKIY